MKKELETKNKNIKIYYTNPDVNELPVVILNTYNNEGKDVFDKCIEIRVNNFILIAISNINWNNDMSPWFAPKLNKADEDCLGKADEYISIIENDIVPKAQDYIENELKIKIKYYAITGYSLAGLLAE